MVVHKSRKLSNFEQTFDYIMCNFTMVCQISTKIMSKDAQDLTKQNLQKLWGNPPPPPPPA